MTNDDILIYIYISDMRYEIWIYEILYADMIVLYLYCNMIRYYNSTMNFSVDFLQLKQTHPPFFVFPDSLIVSFSILNLG